MDNRGALTKTRPRIPKTLRALVWDRHVGLDKGSTLCLCNTKIYQVNFECGHVIPFSKGGVTTIENLRPICGMCNKSMGNTNYYDFFEIISGGFVLVEKNDNIEINQLSQTRPLLNKVLSWGYAISKNTLVRGLSYIYNK